MKVLKFGGTSVGSVEAIESVKRIVEGRQEPVIVVVSAFSGVTDQLYKLSRAASQGDEGYLIEYEQMYARHLTVIDRMVPAAHKAEVLPQVQDKFADLLNILKGLSLIRDLSPRILDTVVGYGEMLSSLILSHVIEGAVHQDSTSFIKTTVQFDKHVVDYPATEERVRRAFQPLAAGVGVRRVHRVGPAHGACDQPGAGRVGLHGLHPGRHARGRQPGDMDGRGRLHDRRPAHHPECLRDRAA